MSLINLHIKLENLTEEQNLDMEISITKHTIEQLEKRLEVISEEQKRLPSLMRTIGLPQEYQDWCYYTKRLELLLQKQKNLGVNEKQ